MAIDVSKLSDSQLELASQIATEAQRQGIDPNYAVAQAYQESRLSQYVGEGDKRKPLVSNQDAYGVMQITPATARGFGFTKEDLMTPEDNIRAGVAIMKHNLDKYQDPATALLAYHQGEPTVDKYLKTNDLSHLGDKGLDYVAKINQNYDLAHNTGYYQEPQAVPVAAPQAPQASQAADENGFIPTKRQMQEEGFAGRALTGLSKNLLSPQNIETTTKAFDVMAHPFAPESLEKVKELQAHPYTPPAAPKVTLPTGQQVMEGVQAIPKTVGEIASSIYQHPLDTAKALSRGLIEDPELLNPAMWEYLPEKLSSSLAKAGVTNKLAQAGTKVAGHALTGAGVGGGAEAIAEAANGEINPQKVLDEARNFAVMGGGFGALGELYKGVRGAPKAPEIPPAGEFQPTESGGGNGIQEEHLFDTEDLGVAPAAAQPIVTPRPAPKPAPMALPAEAIPARPVAKPTIYTEINNAARGENPAGPVETPAETPEVTPAQPSLTKRPNDPALETEAHSIADQIESLGHYGFADSMRQSIDKLGGFTEPKKLDFYKQRLSEYQQQAGAVAERPQETRNMGVFQEGYGPDTKRINDFLPNAPEEVQNTVAQSNKYIQDLTDKINALGYKVEDIKSSSPLHVQELKTKMSQIAGSTSSYLKNAEHIAKDNRFANPEKLASIQDTLSSDFAKADELLAVTPEAVTEAEMNRQRQAAQREEAARLARQSDTFLAHVSREGGIKLSDKLDVTGEDKGIPAGGYNRMFKANAKEGLQSFIELGKADKYLPPDMRLSTNAGAEGGFDATPAYNYLTEKIRNGEQILPYKEEAKVAKEEEYNPFYGHPEEFGLEGQTEAEIKFAEEAKKQAAAEEAKKANAPAPEEFGLTGSNRPADVASAHGAQDMFGAKPEETVTPITVGDNTEYRITKNSNGWSASLVDIDSNKSVMTKTWPFETFGEEGKQKAIDYAKAEAKRAQSYGKPKAEVVKEKTDAEIEAEEETAYEARQAKAEAHVDEGPIGQAIQKIDSGELETKAQIKRFVHKLEKEGIIEDPSDIYEALSDREQYADDVIYEVRDALDSARDDAVQEYADELERDEELAKEERTAEEDKWSDPDYIPFNIERRAKPHEPKPEELPGHDTPYSVTDEEAQRSPSFRVEAKRIRRLYEAGKISSDEFANRIQWALDYTKKEGTHAEIKRGVEILKEKLSKALRKGWLTKEAVHLVEWFINKNPQLVADLGISIRAPKEGKMESGLYSPWGRIIVLMKGSSSEVTPIHEVLHHLERMMPEPIRKAIRKAWADSFIAAKKAADKGDDPVLKKFYDNLVKYHLEGDEKAGKDVKSALANGDVDIEHYQNYNPSEFWAVNGSDIMANRFAVINKGIVNRLKNWLREFGEKIKSLFGMKSDASIIRALDSLQKGDGKFVTNHMLAEEGEYRNFDRKKAKDLQDEFDDLGIPQAVHHGADTLGEKFTSGIGHLKDILKGLAEPKKSVNKMVSGLDDSLTNFQTGFIYGGIGLEKAEAKMFGNKLFKEVRDSADKIHKVAIASVAQMNALHSGHIASAVMLQGKLVFDHASQMFKAVADKFSMRNVFLAEQAIYRKLGKDAGSTLMQSYLEAKRARSIQNEFLNRQAEYERQIASGEDAEKASQDLKNIEFIYRDKIPSYFLLRDADGKVIRDRKGFPIINDDAIDRMIAKEKAYPELRQIMDNWTAVNHNMLDNLVFGGVMSKERGAHLKSIKDYVPWSRITDDTEELHAPSSSISGLSNVSKEKKFARGVVDKQINNIISNMVNNVMMMTRNSARNYAALKIAAQFGTKKANGKLAVFPREGLMPDGSLRTNILINGKRVIIEIKDPHVAQAMLGMESMELPMMSFLSSMQQFGRRGVTINPFFQLYQVVKDAPTAAAVTGLKNPVLAAGKVLASFGSALMPNDPIVKILKSYGVGGFQLAGRTAEKDFALSMGVQNHSITSALLKALDHIGDASDYAQRRIIYKEVLKRTGSETEAIFAANSIIDFMRHGNSKLAQAEVRTVAFMGAFANQIDVLGDAMTGRRLAGVSKGKAAAQFYKATAAFTTLAMIYAMLKMNDPEYQKLDDQTKARNWIIGGYKIPMSTSYSLFFKAIPEMALNYIMTKGTVNEMDMHRLSKAITTAAADSLLGPNPIPAGLRTPLEIVTDHDFFTGGHITPRGMENLQPFEQFNSSTSQLGKTISASTFGALNPIQADHLVKGWFATVGALAMWGSDLFTSDKPEKVWSQNPVIGQMFLPETPHGPEERFYDLKERSDKDYNTWMTLQKRQRQDEAAKFFNENKSTIVLHDYVSQSESGLKALNGEINRIADLPASKMSPAQKTAQMNYYKGLKNQILDNVNHFRLMAERGENFTIPE